MTDPEIADAHLHRAHQRASAVDQDHRAASAPTPCCPTWAARPASTAPSSWPRPACSTSTAWRSSAATSTPSSAARTASCSPSAMEEHRPRDVAAVGYRLLGGGRRGHRATSSGYPVVHPPGLHARRRRRRHRLRPWTSCVRIVRAGPRASRPAGEVLVEESIEGWKEIEMEVMRDAPATASSSAPSRTSTPWACTPATPSPSRRAQTLTDVELPAPARRTRSPSSSEIGVAMRRLQRAVRREPEDGRIIVIEMNPRVSPLLGAGLQGHGLPHRQDGGQARRGLHARRDPERHHAGHARHASSPPSTTCVVKVPRFAFEKFKGADDTLSTRMKAVGEVMAIGTHLRGGACSKAMRSPGERAHAGLGARRPRRLRRGRTSRSLVSAPTAERIFYMAEALRRGWTRRASCSTLTSIDHWFIEPHRRTSSTVEETHRASSALADLDADHMLAAASRWASPTCRSRQLHRLRPSVTVRAVRKASACAGHQDASTPAPASSPARTSYHYKTYERGASERPRHATSPAP